MKIQEFERDEMVMELVTAALQQPPTSRAAYLLGACSGDSQLLAEIEERVEWEERMGDFLRHPAIAAIEALDRPFHPGEEVAGRFNIIREVGRGGMGIVYEAFDHKLRRRVAIKTAQAGYSQSLPPEARAAREVSHFNVCKVYDLHAAETGMGEVEFLSMEFLEGETLNDRVSRNGPVTPAEAKTIALQICAGLAHAHGQGVIHGDLKCGNIILAKSTGGGQRPVVTDFGLATVKVTEGEAGLATLQGGSYDYMAPELQSGARPSVASDIYALGVVFHFMLTGKTPGWTKSSEFSPVASTVTANPLSAEIEGSRQCEELPRPWGAVVQRCLEPSPEDRFSSVEELAEQFRGTASRRKWFAVIGAAAATSVLAVWLGKDNLPHIRVQREAGIRSIAVIPFVNKFGTPDKQYLCDGISEELINSLAQIPDLKVIARTSSFKFNGDQIDVRKVAGTLGVRALVLGRLSDNNGRLRIAVDLVNGIDGTQIWGAQYSTADTQLAGMQGDITRDIAERIRAELTVSDRLKLARAKRINPEAYGLFLRARYEIRLYSPESRLRAVSHLEQALAIDPTFAAAHAELAAAYRLLSASGIKSAAEMLPKAEAAARRALAIDDKLAEAHFAMAGIKRDQWDWTAAQREYQRAIEINPNLAAAHAGFATCLSVMGSYESAIKEAMRARDLDPIAIPPAIALAAVYYNTRRYTDALEILKAAASMDPSAPAPWTWAGIVHGGRRQFSEAAEAFEKAMKMGDRTPATQCYYAHALARSGRRQEAIDILERVQRSNEFVPAPTLAIAYAGLNEKDRAVRLLESSYEAKEPLLQYLNVESHFDSLRDDKRFNNLAVKLRLPR